MDTEEINLIKGDLQTQVLTLRALEFESHTRDIGYLRIHKTKEALIKPYMIWEHGVDKTTIPIGTYSFNEAEIRFQSGQVREIWGTIGYRAGEFVHFVVRSKGVTRVGHVHEPADKATRDPAWALTGQLAPERGCVPGVGVATFNHNVLLGRAGGS